jgi:deoxyribose-phosphate aldolase
MKYTYEEIAGMIDHSLLKPTLTDDEVNHGCKIADEYRVASVCVRPCDVKQAKEILVNSNVKVTTVIGFPHGTTTMATKMLETTEAIENGAAELDIVINIGKMKSEEYSYIKAELSVITSFAHAKEVKVKVIFENCYLTDEEKMKACEICNEVGVDWVKTSTGYGTGGAEEADIKLMRKHCKPEIQVKAAGGIRTLEKAIKVRKLGCTRIGATATVDILDAIKKKK